jgi:hypothetical protein
MAAGRIFKLKAYEFLSAVFLSHSAEETKKGM